MAECVLHTISDVNLKNSGEDDSVCCISEHIETDNFIENTLSDISSLTNREQEILHFIVSGKTNKEIASGICRSERTVEYHRNRLMKKLNAHNAANLVKRAILMGIE